MTITEDKLYHKMCEMAMDMWNLEGEDWVEE